MRSRSSARPVEEFQVLVLDPTQHTVLGPFRAGGLLSQQQQPMFIGTQIMYPHLLIPTSTSASTRHTNQAETSHTNQASGGFDDSSEVDGRGLQLALDSLHDRLPRRDSRAGNVRTLPWASAMRGSSIWCFPLLLFRYASRVATLGAALFY